MGNYLNFRRKDISEKALKKELRTVYNLHKKKDKNQFKNDFGQINSFNDVFTIHSYGGGGIMEVTDLVQIKTGVLDREFYSKEFLEDVTKVLVKFGYSL